MKGEKLKEKVEKIGIPFRQIAELMGISEQNLQNKFKVDDVKTSFICDLSNKLNKSVYFFLGDDLIVNDKDEDLNNSISKQDDTTVPYLIYNEIKEENKILHEKLLEKAEEIGKLKAKIDGVREENPIYHIPAHAVAEQSPEYIHPIINKK